MTEEFIDVLPDNKYKVEEFIRENYENWDSIGGNGHSVIFKNYPLLTIKYSKNLLDVLSDRQGLIKMQIIFKENINKSQKSKLIELATQN